MPEDALDPQMDTASVRYFLDSLVFYGGDYSSVCDSSIIDRLNTVALPMVESEVILSTDKHNWYEILSAARLIQASCDTSYDDGKRIAYLTQASTYASYANRPFHKAWAEYLLGTIFNDRYTLTMSIDDMDSALYHFETSEQTYSRDTMPWPKVYSILYQAELRCNQGSIKQALLDVYRLHPFLHEIADTNALAWYYALLGNIHYNGGELDSAKDNSTKGLQLYTYINDTIHMMVANRRLGEIAYSQGDYFQAISRSYHGLSLINDLNAKHGNDTIRLRTSKKYHYRIISNCYQAQGEFLKAIEILNKSNSLGNGIYSAYERAENYSSTAFCLRELNHFQRAEKFAEQALGYAEESKNKQLISRCLITLLDIYEVQGKYDKAQQTKKELSEVQVSLPWGAEYRDYLITQQQISFRITQLTDSLRFTHQMEMAEAEKREQLMLSIGGGITLVLLAVCGMLFLRSRSNKHRAEKIREQAMREDAERREMDERKVREQLEIKYLNAEERLEYFDKQLERIHDPLHDGLDSERKEELVRIHVKNVKGSEYDENILELIDFFMKNHECGVKDFAERYKEKTGSLDAARTIQEKVLKSVYDAILGQSMDRSRRKERTKEELRKILDL